MDMFIKKYIKFLILVLLLIGISSTLFFYSNVKRIENKKEYSLANVEQIDTNLIRNFNIIEKNVKYLLKTDLDEENEISIYKDKEDNEYIVENNMLVGYLSNKRIINNVNKIRRDNIDFKGIADNIFTKIVKASKLNKKNYVISDMFYQNSYDEYFYTYTKYINDIKTNDSITISINSDGTLSSFNAAWQGKFDDIKSKIKKQDVEVYIEKYMSKKYNYIDSYTLDDMFITIENGNYIIKNYIGIQYNDTFDSIEVDFKIN